MGISRIETRWTVVTPDRIPKEPVLVFWPVIGDNESAAAVGERVKKVLIDHEVGVDQAHLKAVEWVTDLKETFGTIDHISTQLGLRVNASGISPVMVMGTEVE